MVAESERKGLSINFKKTKSMVISKKEAPTCNLKVKDKIIKHISAFNYIGSTITEDSMCVSEVKRRIALSLNQPFRNCKKSLETGTGDSVTSTSSTQC